MKNAILTDVPAGRKYNLTELVKEHGNNLTIGRNRQNNIIALGINSKEERISNKDMRKKLNSASRQHGQIFYHDDAFFIADNYSTNGTFIGPCKISGQLILCGKNKLFFGQYGPVIYEEIE